MSELRDRMRHAFDLGTSMVEPLDPPPAGPHLPHIDLEMPGGLRPPPSPRCGDCGYDLRVMAGEHCPECGGTDTLEQNFARGFPLAWIVLITLVALMLALLVAGFAYEVLTLFRGL